jgi:hypothetical protein
MEKNPSSELPEEIDIHYEKVVGYRVFYGDGAQGGLTPHGNLFFELYVERPATPTVVRHKIVDRDQGPQARLGEVLERRGKLGIIRSVECGVVMNLDTATRFYDWLGKRLTEAAEVGMLRKEEE